MIGPFLRQISAAACLALLAAAGAAFAEPISVRSDPVPLSERDRGETRVGRLVFLGGLHLQAEAEGFGGFSGLHVSEDGARLIAVSDMGYWLEADLVHGPDGGIRAVHNARLSPMLGLSGKPLNGKRQGDAESLTADGDHILVSFERRHRVWRYPWTEDMSKARPTALPAPADLATVKRNQGLEAIQRLPGGGLLLLTEESLDEEGHIRGWLGLANPGDYAPLRLRRAPPFAVTDAALLPGGAGVLILERRFSVLGGLGIKLRRLALSDLAPGALLEGEDVAEFRPGDTIDNFEAVAARAHGGETIVYLLSDDNYRKFQRTLLMTFRLETQPAAGRQGPLEAQGSGG